MNRKALITLIAGVSVLALVAALRFDDVKAIAQAVGLAPAQPVAVAAKQKPICSQAIVPTGADCHSAAHGELAARSRRSGQSDD